MSFNVVLYVNSSASEESIAEIVLGLGGEYRPDEWTFARVSRGRRHVWINIEVPDEDFMPPGAPERISEILRGQAGLQIDMRLSTFQGRYWCDVARDIVLAIGKDYRVAIHGQKNVFDLTEFHRRMTKGVEGTELFY